MKEVAFAVALASLFAATSVHARPEYPGSLQEQIGTVCIVNCLTCHNDPEGGSGDKLKMFGALLGGAVSGKRKDIFDVISTTDTDGDMMKDLDEVKAGRDPLISGPSSICAPSYGCGARMARSPLSDDRITAPALLAAAAVLTWFGRRRAKPRAS